MNKSSIFAAMAVLFGSVFKDRPVDFSATAPLVHGRVRGGKGYHNPKGHGKGWAGKPGYRGFTGEQGENRLYPDTAEGKALREDRRKDRNIAKRARQKARRLWL